MPNSPPCPHPRRGRVTNQAWGYDPQRLFAMVEVCDRPVCIRAAKVMVKAHTGEEADYIPDDPGEIGEA